MLLVAVVDAGVVSTSCSVGRVTVDVAATLLGPRTCSNCLARVSAASMAAAPGSGSSDDTSAHASSNTSTSKADEAAAISGGITGTMASVPTDATNTFSLGVAGLGERRLGAEPIDDECRRDGA